MTPPSDLNAKAILESGKLELSEQNFKCAVDSLTKAIELDGSLFEAFYYRALAKIHIYKLQQEQRQFDGLIELHKSAFDDVSESIRLNPTHLDAYLLRSDLFVGFNMQFDKAIEDLQSALKVAPDSVVALLKLAGIFCHPFSQRHSEALTLVHRAASIDPSNESAVRMKFQLHKGFGQTAEAIEDIGFLIAKEPGKASLYVDRAELHEKLHECDAALADLNSACQISDEWKLLRSEHHMLHRQFDLAEKDLLHRVGIGDSSWHHFPHMKLATLYVGCERYDKALEQLDTLLQLGPESMTTNYFLTRSFIHLRLGNTEQALRDCEEALSLIESEGKNNSWGGIENNLSYQKDMALALINRGAIWYKQDRKLAKNDFDGAYRVMSSEKDKGVIGKLGETFLSTGDYQSAERMFSEIIIANPKCERAYWQRGKAYLKQNEMDKAVADFSKCIQLQPNHIHALIARAEVYELQRKDALAALDRKTASEASARTHSLPEEFSEWALFHGDGGFYR